MAKKQTFIDKVKRGSKDEPVVEYVKVVRAFKADNGAWKFQTKMVAVTDENRSEIYK